MSKWVAWVCHFGSRTWHEVSRSEDFDTVFVALTTYVRQNHVTVRVRIIMSGYDPANLPSDYAPPDVMP